MGFIYILENKINGKCYVGQTIRSVYERVKCHYKKDTPIGRALRKYGIHNFNIHKFIIPIELLTFFEIELIKKLNSINNKYGYNICKGGEGGDTFTNNKNKEQIRINHRNGILKIGAPWKNKKLSKEHKEKLSIAHKGQVAWNKNRCWTKKERLKLSLAHIGKMTGSQHPFSKKIKCVETNIIYDSIRIAKIKTGINNIGLCCSGRLKTSGGYHWEYCQEAEG